MNYQEAAKYLAPLKRYIEPTRPEIGHAGSLVAVHGVRGPVYFIISIDHDGQVEASLSLTTKRRGQTPKPCTKEHAAAFFRAWGVEPFEGGRFRRIRHYVVKRGRPQ